jgi:hypothetical protein
MVNADKVDWSSLDFKEGNWKEFYPGTEEVILPDARPPRGPAVQLNLFADAAFVMDILNRRSTTGTLLFMNKTPIKWVREVTEYNQDFDVWSRVCCIKDCRRDEREYLLLPTHDGHSYQW